MHSEITLRDATPADWPAILAINTASLPAVSDITLQELEALAGWASALRVAVLGEEVVGFLLCLRPGLPYASANYRWFSARYPKFFYVDRIALGPAARRRGVGRRLYGEAAAAAARSGGPLLCEVNIKPRNDQSLAFHEALGFSPVGEQDTTDGKRVVMLSLQVETHAEHRAE